MSPLFLRGFMRRIKCLRTYVFYALAGSLLAGASAYPIYAQQQGERAIKVDVRASVQDGFIRFVFSGADMPQARVAQLVGQPSLKITFNSAVQFGAPDIENMAPKPVVSIDGNAVQIDVAGMQRQRHVRLGQRLLVDIFTADAPKALAAEVKAEVKADVAADVKPDTKAAVAVVDSAPKTKSDVNVEVDAEVLPPVDAALTPDAAALAASVAGAAPVSVPAKLPAAKAAEYKGQAVITFGSTHGLMLAAFEHDDHLWVISSGDQNALAPQIGGAQADDIKLVETRSIDGGRLYRFSFPDGAFVHPEGGGLIWRLHINGARPTSGAQLGTVDLSDRSAGARYKLDLPAVGSVLRVPNPDGTGDMAAILVSRAGAFVGVADRFVDFEFVPALIGAFVVPKVDGFNVSVLPDVVLFGRTDGGLRFAPMGVRRMDRGAALAVKDADTPPVLSAGQLKRIYDFQGWGMGGAEQYFAMRRALDARIAVMDADEKLPEMIVAAKFMLAQGLPHEALGYMQMAQGLLPLLRESADYQAVLGAVYALLGHNAQAEEAFKNRGLANNQEIALWRAYVLGAGGQYDEAQGVLPKDAVLSLLRTYPARIQMSLIPPLLDVVMTYGDVRLAEDMLDMYDKNVSALMDSERDLMLSYYRGRAALLRGDAPKGEGLLQQAASGARGPYPVRATLALVARPGVFEFDDAVQRLERFRFGWRGDAYESEVLEALGMLYVNAGDYKRGLGILRDAAGMTASAKDREMFLTVMRRAFSDLFLRSGNGDVSPLDAVAVATEFNELMPTGEAGEDITLSVAGKMRDIDLLDRAAGLIEPMVPKTATPARALKYAEQAAGIRLLDRNPKAALEVVDTALKRPDVTGGNVAEPELRRLRLLAAQSKADMNRVDEAISDLRGLESGDDSLRLMTDIAWKAQRWGLAADTLGQLIAHANLNATQQPSQEAAQMVFNRALALNLAGDRDALENLSIGYRDIMRRTSLYRPFMLVTRSARDAQLADRDTLLSLVSEVGLFQDVLNSYKNNDLVPVAGSGSQ